MLSASIFGSSVRSRSPKWQGPMVKTRRGDRVVNFLLVFLSFAFGLLLMEIGLRTVSSRASLRRFPNYRRAYISMLRSGFPASYHPILGWYPKPGFRGKQNIWYTMVSIDSQGLRS